MASVDTDPALLSSLSAT